MFYLRYPILGSSTVEDDPSLWQTIEEFQQLLELCFLRPGVVSKKSQALRIPTTEAYPILMHRSRGCDFVGLTLPQYQAGEEGAGFENQEKVMYLANVNLSPATDDVGIEATIQSPNLTGNSCYLGLPSTLVVTNRRHVVDEAMGVVDMFLGFPGLDHTQGTTPMPDSHAFRVEGGKIRYVHTVSSCVTAGCGVNGTGPLS
ncbi:uncharacterized protein PAC_02528 [Phialocephala subalpina]|uniref:DUF8021 domain-containing protein n=1 Tax=Phialocephala subalpina TaxID=576137 RepID=A0A1L7WIQ8_9HELO|nr:uncharacterized protein PAC_02528 [Phialocephala subalpina]